MEDQLLAVYTLLLIGLACIFEQLHKMFSPKNEYKPENFRAGCYNMEDYKD